MSIPAVVYLVEIRVFFSQFCDVAEVLIINKTI